MTAQNETFNSGALLTWQEGSQPLQNKWLHPAIVDGIKHLFHNPQLECLDPTYFIALTKFAKTNGWILSEDRRHSTFNHGETKRRRWLPTMLLAFTMVANCSMAESEDASIEPESSSPRAHQMPDSPFDATLLAMAKNTDDGFQLPTPTHDPLENVENILNTPNLKPESGRNYWQKRILHILTRHFVDPERNKEIAEDDFAAMASYFSQYPNVRDLFTSIENSKWQLKYAEKTYETQIHGSRMSIDSITVFFDPRSAAQFKFYRACTDKIPYCVASPADVLLHELLHVQAVVNDPDTFIAQGGMSSLMYPYEHERHTIEAEKRLYQSMTAIDGQPRPLRSEHIGRHVLAACVTCLQ